MAERMNMGEQRYLPNHSFRWMLEIMSSMYRPAKDEGASTSQHGSDANFGAQTEE